MTDEGVKNVVATPLYLDDKYGIPDFATGSQAQETLSRLEQISEGMNAAFDIRDGKAYITPVETAAIGGVSANDTSANGTSAGNVSTGGSAESASADGASASAASSDGNGA